MIHDSTYQLLRYAFLGTTIACGICLAIAVLLFFTLNIPKVVSDLTGRTARKAIENIRLQNEKSGDKSYQSSAVNLERGKLTDKISQSGRLIPNEGSAFGTGLMTEKISTQQLDAVEEVGETAVLSEQPTPDSPYGETAVLAQEPAPQIFAVEFEITYIHTDEVVV